MRTDGGRPRGIPLRDPRFWVIQALVLAIDTGHTALENAGILAEHSVLYLLSVSAFLVPVVYAALGFGLQGAVPTVVWALVLSLPEISQHDATTRAGILAQFVILLVISVVVALRVDRERAATRAAEAANRQLSQLNDTAQAALASSRAAERRLETYIELATDAQEEERKRLSRELHDDILQALVVTKSTIETAGTLGPEASRARLAGAQDVLGDAIVNLRRYCRDLRPSLLDDLGLVDAVDWLVGDLRARTDLVVDIEAAGVQHRLAGNDELLTFRIVQEALHNVERHAEATRARVCLDYTEDALVVTVSDDGRGMRRGQERAGVRRADAGLGLRGMDERAKLLRGTLSIRSDEGNGTELSLVVPFPDAAGTTPGAPSDEKR